MNEREQLNFLAAHFNPFEGEVSEESLKIIQELGLEEYLENPFNFSNEILRRLHEESPPQNQLQ